MLKIVAIVAGVLVLLAANDWFCYYMGSQEASTAAALQAQRASQAAQSREAQIFKAQIAQQAKATSALHDAAVAEDQKLAKAQAALAAIPISTECSVGSDTIAILNGERNTHAQH